LIVIYGIAGLCMAATVAPITGVGMIRLLLPPISDQADVDQAGQVIGSADARVD
jgi:hypothetical protein